MKTDFKEICYACNLYEWKCDGSRFELCKEKFDCRHRVCFPNNTVNPIQVHGFTSLYATKRRCGVNRLTAFVEAIVQSSDDVFKEAKKLHSKKINQWKNRKKVNITDNKG